MQTLAKANRSGDKYVFSVYGVLLIFGYFVPSEYLQLFIIGGVFYTSLIYKSCIPALLYVAVNISLDVNVSSWLLLSATAPVYASALREDYKFSPKTILTIPAFLVIVSFSVIFGVDVNLKTAVLFVLAVFLYSGMSERKMEWQSIKKYAYLSFCMIAAILLIQASRGSLKLMYGRLSVNDNIRALANAIAFPMVIAINNLLSRGLKTLKEKAFNVLMIACGMLILMGTLSKGAFAAVFAAFVTAFLFSGGKRGQKLLLVAFVLAALCFALTYLGQLNIFRLERLTEENNGFSGRTDIWNAYFTEMISSPKSVLFGFGPGDVRRLGISIYYSHSLFLDVLFSYGIVGFTAFMIMVLDAGYKVWKSKNPVSYSLFVFTCTLFLTHGTATYVFFYVILAAALCIRGDSSVKKGAAQTYHYRFKKSSYEI